MVTKAEGGNSLFFSTLLGHTDPEVLMNHIIDSRGIADVSSGFLPITMRPIDKITSIAKCLIELVLYAKFLLEVHYQICIQSLKHI